MRDYALVAFVVGLVPFILWRAWIGAIAWTWIGLMNPHLYTWALSEFPFAQVIGLAFLAGWIISNQKRPVPATPGFVGMCLLFIFVSLKTPFSWNEDIAWTLYNRYAKVVVAAILIATLIYSEKRVRLMLWTVLFSIGVFYGVKGGLFAIATGGNHHVQGPEPSFIGGNTHIGVALIMVMPLFIAFGRDTYPKFQKWLRLGGVAGFWLTGLAVLFTYSRGAWLGLGAVGALVFMQSKRKLLTLAVLVPIGMSAIAFIPDKVFKRADTIGEYKEDSSAMQRLQGWGVAWNVASRHPLGSGFTLDATPVDIWMSYANFHRPDFTRANAAHSIYFQIIGDHGFGGLLLFLLTLFGSLWTLARVRIMIPRDSPHDWMGQYAVAIFIGLVGYSISGAFVSLAYFDLFYTFVILAAVLFREAKAVMSFPAKAAVPANIKQAPRVAQPAKGAM